MRIPPIVSIIFALLFTLATLSCRSVSPGDARVEPQATEHLRINLAIPGDVFEAALPLISKAAPRCLAASSASTVVGGSTSDEILVSQCSAPTGGADVAVPFNTAPIIRLVEPEPGTTLCSNQAVRMRAFAVEREGDAITYDWSTSVDDRICLAPNHGEAFFSSIAPGRYDITLRARDAKGRQSQLVFSLNVAHCDGQELEPVCPGLAVSELTDPALSANASGRCNCANDPAKPFRAPYQLRPRSVMLTRIVTASSDEPLTERSGWCNAPPGSGWTGSFLKARRTVPCRADVVVESCSRTYEVDCGYGFQGPGLPDYRPISLIPHSSLMLDQPIASSSGAGGPPTGVPDAVWLALRERYRKKIHYRNPNLALSFLPPGHPLTQVAVVDSAAHGYDDIAHADTYGHGRAVGRVIADLSCDAANAMALDPTQSEPAYCAKSIHNYLALDRVSGDAKDETNGGFFGGLVSLDSAINHALNDWLVSSSRAPLVINISAGWDERHLGRARSQLEDALNASDPSSIAARIKVSLQRASCLGALVIAAAGNADIRTDATHDDINPIYPAAWEKEDAPSDADCSSWGPAFVAPAHWSWGPRHRAAPPPTGSCSPLVYAVSGVGDGDLATLSPDMLLANSRIGGISRIAAQGLAVVTDDVRGTATGTQNWTLALTGTSMAAATVSGIAAALWSMQPDLDAHELMTKYVITNDNYARDFLTKATAPSDFAGNHCSTAVTGMDPARVANHCYSLQQLKIALHQFNSVTESDPCAGSAYVNSAQPLWMPVATQYGTVTVAPGTANDPFDHVPTFGGSYAPWVMPQPGSATCGGRCYFDTADGNSFKGAFVDVIPGTITKSRIVFPTTSSGFDVATLFGDGFAPVPSHDVSFRVPIGVIPSVAQTGTMLTTVHVHPENIVRSESFLVW